MTWIVIAGIVVLLVFLLLWAVLVAASRADAGTWEVDPLLTREPSPHRPRPVATAPGVTDMATLRARLGAVVVLLGARRIALVATTRSGRTVLAAAGAEDAPGMHELTAPAAAGTMLVASRDRREPPFTPADLRLLAAIGETLGDVITRGDPEPRRSRRFPRAGDPATQAEANRTTPSSPSDSTTSPRSSKRST